MKQNYLHNKKYRSMQELLETREKSRKTIQHIIKNTEDRRCK